MPGPVSCSPVLPLCQGDLGNLVSQTAQRLFLNQYSGISVLQGGEAAAACLAKDLAADNIWGSVDSHGICWLPGASQGLELTLQWCLVPSQHLLGSPQDSLLPPQGLWAGGPQAGGVPSPLSGQTIPQSTVASRAQGGLGASCLPHCKVNTTAP